MFGRSKHTPGLTLFEIVKVRHYTWKEGELGILGHLNYYEFLSRDHLFLPGPAGTLFLVLRLGPPKSCFGTKEQLLLWGKLSVEERTVTQDRL